MAEGIIFGGFLLSEEEFKIVFQEWYQQRGVKFKIDLQTKVIDPINKMIQMGERINSKGKRVNKIIKVKGLYDAAQIYSAWEYITQEYFGNSSVQLLTGIKINGKEYQWSNIIDEKALINQSGINVTKSGLQKLQQKMDEVGTVQAAAAVQNFLNEHYDDLLKTLNGYHLSREDAHDLHLLLAYRKSKLNNADFHFTNSTYNKIIFSHQQNADGKRLDAFMNHVGKYNAQLFSLMSVARANATTLDNLNLKDHGGFDAMFTSKRGEIQSWLLDSLNSASWLTGGDIVVVNEHGAVIYNIQLKTTGRGKVFDVASSSLLSFARDIMALIDQNVQPSQLADLMYKRLKTSSANDFKRAENFLESEAYEWVKENLKIK